MVWSVDTDDFRGDCDREEDTFADFKGIPGVKLQLPVRKESNYPLLRTLNEAIELSLDEIRQEEQIDDKDNEIINNNNGSDHKNEPGSANINLVNSLVVLTVAAIFSRLL